MEFQNRIRELREADGKYGCGEFARYASSNLHCHFTKGALSQWETYKNVNPSWQVVETLADYFDVTTDYLMGLTDYRPSSKELFDDKEKKESRHPNLKTLREAKGILSVRALERQLKDAYGDKGPSLAFLSELERGRAKGKNFNHIILLAKTFGVTCDYLMGRTKHSLDGSCNSPVLPEARLLLKQLDERCQRILDERHFVSQGA